MTDDGSHPSSLLDAFLASWIGDDFQELQPSDFSGGLLLAMVRRGYFESFLSVNHEFATPQSPIGRYTSQVLAKNVGPLLVGGG